MEFEERIQEIKQELEPAAVINEEESAPSTETEVVEETTEELNEEVEQPKPATIPLKRFNEVYGKLKSLERELESKKQAPQEPSREPKLEDFDYDDQKYNEALVEHRVNQRLAAKTHEQQLEAAKQQAIQQELSELENEIKFESREDSVRTKHPDYDTIARNPNLVSKYPRAMIRSIEASEYGPQIAYELGKNEAVALKIASLSPARIGFEIGQIHQRIKENSSKPPVARVTKAPPPISPITGTTEPELSDKPLTEMSDVELRKKIGLDHLV
jgi:hypothetical protein